MWCECLCESIACYSATQLLDTHPLIVNAKDKSLIQQLVMECITQIEEYREQATEEVGVVHCLFVRVHVYHGWWWCT